MNHGLYNIGTPAQFGVPYGSTPMGSIPTGGFMGGQPGYPTSIPSFPTGSGSMPIGGWMGGQPGYPATIGGVQPPRYPGYDTQNFYGIGGTKEKPDLSTAYAGPGNIRTFAEAPSAGSVPIGGLMGGQPAPVTGQPPSFSNQQIWDNQNVFASGNPDAIRARLAQTSPGVNFSDSDIAMLAGQSRGDRGDLVSPFGGTGPGFTSYLSGARQPTPLEMQNQQAGVAFGHQGDFGPVARQAAPAFAAAAMTGGASIGGQAAREASANNSGPAYRGANADGSVPTGGFMDGVLGSGLGLAGSIDQQRRSQDYADWARNQGQPYRDMLGASYANPSGYLSSPEVTGAVQQGTNALARSLSMQGNPVGSGGALQQLQNYSTNQQLDRLAQYRQQLGGFGGLNAINQSIPGAVGAAIDARGNAYNAGGSLLQDIFGRGGIGSNIFGQIPNPGASLPTDPYGGGQVDFGNDPSLGLGDASQFDPNIDWGNLYG